MFVGNQFSIKVKKSHRLQRIASSVCSVNSWKLNAHLVVLLFAGDGEPVALFK